MKVFGRTIFGKASITEKFKGFFTTGISITPQRRTFWLGERNWADRCKRNLTTYMSHTLAKSQILTIAGQCVADGIFLQPSTEDDPHAERAKDALYECEQLNKRLNMRSKLHDTFFNMALYGTCFWEKTTEPTFDTRIIPQQEYVEPAEQDQEGNIIRWRQRAFATQMASWTLDEIIDFSWNKTSWSWPYGTSLLAGLDQDFETLDQIKTDIKEYAHKNAFPKELFSIGDGQYMPSPTEAELIKSKLKNWEPGEYFITSYPIEHKVGGVGDREPKGIDKILTFIKEDAIDGTMTPPVSYQYSSTYASSKEMAKTQRSNIILPLQTIVAQELEDSLYKPYLESLGYSVKLCPEVKFDPPDAGFFEEAQAYAQLVGAGILTPELAASEMGYTLEQIEGMRAEKLERQQQQMELFKQKSQAFGQPQQQEKQPFNAKQPTTEGS